MEFWEMRAGQLRHVITFQEPTRTSDSLGGYSESWADVTGLTSLHAAIWPVSANERVKNQQLDSEITHRIRMRYIETCCSLINHEMQIVFGERTFKIISIINPEERNQMLDILVTENAD